MARQKFKTLTEQMYYVLLCLKEECCGTEILLRIEDMTQGRVTVGSGTLYNLLEEFLSSLDVYGDFTIDYEIAEEEDLSAGDIAEIQEILDDLGLNGEVEEAKELGIYMTIEADGMSDEDDMQLCVIKIDGEWYLNPSM